MASIVYGQPRMTHDIDLVVKLSQNDVAGLPVVFSQEQFYCPPSEVILCEVSREVRGHFNVIHQSTGLKADFYPVGKDPLHHWAMGNRRTIDFEADSIQIAPPEYVILRKLQFFTEGGSEKHVTDIKNMLRYSTNVIDVSVLKEKAGSLGLQGQLSNVLNAEI
ncbi:MAG: hypothetical protein OEV87_06600 [Phycisphaerae bacterium]|nr:hypothetical protein [Phycisphaerae bacterium]